MKMSLQHMKTALQEKNLARLTRIISINIVTNINASMIYNMCVQKETNYNEQLYERYRDTIKNYLKEFVINLFELVIIIFNKVLPGFKKAKEADILNELKKRWSNHEIMVKWMEKFFAYIVILSFQIKKFNNE